MSLAPVFYDDSHLRHRPDMWLYRGERLASREVPERAVALKQALLNAGYEIAAPDDFGRQPIERVHAARYIDFLETAHADWHTLPGASQEVIGSSFPIGFDLRYPRGISGRAGFHMGDLACPINAGTWRAAYGSAQAAINAAQAVIGLTGTRQVYSLCRPPGHHASHERAAGYCYLNNAAIAAQYLIDRGAARISIIDIDVHHGNGTQDIFYDRGDVQFVSIHGDPNEFYPFFWGYEDQVGIGEGEGKTVNFSLPLGADEPLYLGTLAKALEAVCRFAPDYIVVSLGLDIFVGDPYAAFRISTDGFGRIAREINALATPTVVIQEGGYICPELGLNLLSYLSG